MAPESDQVMPDPVMDSRTLVIGQKRSRHDDAEIEEIEQDSKRAKLNSRSEIIVIDPDSENQQAFAKSQRGVATNAPRISFEQPKVANGAQWTSAKKYYTRQVAAGSHESKNGNAKFDHQSELIFINDDDDNGSTEQLNGTREHASGGLSSESDRRACVGSAILDGSQRHIEDVLRGLINSRPDSLDHHLPRSGRAMWVTAKKSLEIINLKPKMAPMIFAQKVLHFMGNKTMDEIDFIHDVNRETSACNPGVAVVLVYRTTQAANNARHALSTSLCRIKHDNRIFQVSIDVCPWTDLHKTQREEKIQKFPPMGKKKPREWFVKALASGRFEAVQNRFLRSDVDMINLPGTYVSSNAGTTVKPSPLAVQDFPIRSKDSQSIPIGLCESRNSVRLELSASHGNVKIRDLPEHEKSLQERYWGVTDPDSLIYCPLCIELGHMVNTCPLRTCFNCKAIDQHFASECAQNLKCSECRERGHDENQCTMKLARSSADGFHCDICSGAHLEEKCAYLWRTYNPSLARDVNKVASLYVYCYSCGTGGHWGDDCPSKSNVACESNSDTFSYLNANIFYDENAPARESENGIDIRGSAKFSATNVNDADIQGITMNLPTRPRPQLPFSPVADQSSKSATDSTRERSASNKSASLRALDAARQKFAAKNSFAPPNEQYSNHFVPGNPHDPRQYDQSRFTPINNYQNAVPNDADFPPAGYYDHNNAYSIRGAPIDFSSTQSTDAAFEPPVSGARRPKRSKSQKRKTRDNTNQTVLRTESQAPRGKKTKEAKKRTRANKLARRAKMATKSNGGKGISDATKEVPHTGRDSRRKRNGRKFTES